MLEIGSFLISLQPPGAKQFVVDLFGTDDKLALNVAIVIGALVIRGARDPGARFHRPWTDVGFAAIALLGLFASLRDPLVDPLLAVAAAVLGVGWRTASLGWLLRLATPHRPGRADAGLGSAPIPGVVDRRRRARPRRRASAGCSSTRALGGAGLPRHSGRRRPRRLAAAGAELAVPGISPLVVPNRDFYRIDIELLTPRLDAAPGA